MPTTQPAEHPLRPRPEEQQDPLLAPGRSCGGACLVRAARWESPRRTRCPASLPLPAVSNRSSDQEASSSSQAAERPGQEQAEEPRRPWAGLASALRRAFSGRGAAQRVPSSEDEGGGGGGAAADSASAGEAASGSGAADLERAGSSGGGSGAEIEPKPSGSPKLGRAGSRSNEKVCLICLEALTPDDFESGRAIALECNCRGDLALRHKECAVKWAQVDGWRAGGSPPSAAPLGLHCCGGVAPPFPGGNSFPGGNFLILVATFLGRAPPLEPANDTPLPCCSRPSSCPGAG